MNPLKIISYIISAHNLREPLAVESSLVAPAIEPLRHFFKRGLIVLYIRLGVIRPIGKSIISLCDLCHNALLIRNKFNVSHFLNGSLRIWSKVVFLFEEFFVFFNVAIQSFKPKFLEISTR